MSLLLNLVMTENKSEEAIHIEIVDFLRVALPLGSVVHHSPNAGMHKIAYRMKQSRLGMIAGWPDLEIFVPLKDWTASSPWAAIFLEIKAAKGRLSDNQKNVHVLLRELGNHVCVVRSVKECAQELTAFVKLRAV